SPRTGTPTRVQPCPSGITPGPSRTGISSLRRRVHFPYATGARRTHWTRGAKGRQGSRAVTSGRLDAQVGDLAVQRRQPYPQARRGLLLVRRLPQDALDV